jgi:hypothetical protein
MAATLAMNSGILKHKNSKPGYTNMPHKNLLVKQMQYQI